MKQTKRTSPLADLRILDLTQFLSGPYASQILADLGADVIKVESLEGDFSRHIPPHFVGDDSVYYLSVNRSKRSLAVDMKKAAGLDLVRRLALASDVVLENFRPGVLDRLGLRVGQLRAEQPRLIWCSISGFGQTGPYRDKPAYDMIVQALSGGMSLTGERDGPAVRAGIPIGDIAAGVYSCIAILSAVVRRNSTGQGEAIDISMLDCQAAMLCYQGAYYLHSGEVPNRQGSGHDSIPTYRSLVCKCGTQIVITANTERMWQGLCRAAGLPHLTEDPRFTNNRQRHKHRDALDVLLQSAFLGKDAQQWVELLEAEGVPVAVVNTLDKVMVDPQILHRNMVISLNAADGRSIRVMGNPIRLQEAGADPPSFPPRLGENSHEVLSEVLGLSNREIADLAQEGVISATLK